VPELGNIPERCHDDIKAIVDYWRSIHPKIGLPGRQHFDPVDIPQLLANLRLIDVHTSPMRFRIRLMGSQLVAAFNQDHTGKFYDEIFEGFDDSDLFHKLRAVVETHEPNWRKGDHRLNPVRNYVLMERVALPLASDGVNVDMLLMLMHFEPRFEIGKDQD
jgi:hypothetical protein